MSLYSSRERLQSLRHSFKRAATFSLARQNHWLDNSDEFFPHEEAQLLKESPAELDSKLGRIIKQLLLVSSLKLVGDANEPGLLNRIGFHGAKSAETTARQRQEISLQIKLLIWSVLALVGSAILLLLFGCYLQYKFDLMSIQMRPRLRPGVAKATSTKLDSKGEIMCALKDDILYGDHFEMDSFERINQLMDLLGNPIRAQLNATFISVMVLVSGSIVFYALPLLFFTHKLGKSLQLDSLACLVTPASERRRFAKQLERLFDDILGWIEVTRDEGARQQRLRRQFEFQPTTRTRSTVAAGRNIIQANRLDQLKFVMLLDSLRSLHLVRPIVVCNEWRHDMHQLVSFLLVVFLLISSTLPTLSLLVQLGIELSIRTNERHKLHECERWHPNGTLFKPAILLRRLPNELLFYDQHERQAYETCRRDHPLELLRLMLAFETRHLFGWRVLLSCTAVTLIQLFLSSCSTLWTSIFVASFLDKIAWLTQIRHQLASCRSLAERLIETDQSDSEEGCKMRRSKSGPVGQSERLVAHLTIAYVNYELFRRHYKPFRNLTNFLTFQVMAFSVCAFFALYTVANQSETRFQAWSVFVSSCVLVTLNLYLIVASYSSKLTQSAMLQLVGLLGRLAHKRHLLLSPTIDLWRRQLMDERELNLHNSTKVLTSTICYSKIVAFNAQLIAVWLLLLRSINN